MGARLTGSPSTGSSATSHRADQGDLWITNATRQPHSIKKCIPFICDVIELVRAVSRAYEVGADENQPAKLLAQMRIR